MSALESLSQQLSIALQEVSGQLALAESCTGGLVAQSVTAIAGSSRWFDRGFVTYSNAAKTEMLGVPAALIATHGAVSEPVAVAMALGALTHSQASITGAITGIAGPGGGSASKPVGMVCLAWAMRLPAGAAPVTVVETCHFSGDRTSIRQQAAGHLLAGLLERTQQR